MSSKIKKPIGILGVGSFGTVIANNIAMKHDVIVYARKQNTIDNININRVHRDIQINERVKATMDIELLAQTCDIIFPVIPSYSFREAIQKIAPYLSSNHIMIHCTKGFAVDKDIDQTPLTINPNDLKTMSELILSETPVYRVGCMSGPNLAKEIVKKEPAGSVIASKFNEVIDLGIEAMENERFQIYKSNDIRGIELAGIFKNYIAIAAGATSGLGYGENVRALLITKGISEMIDIGNALGVSPKSFLGLAGIGDLVATCSSPLSRNYTVGYRLAQGETLDQIKSTMTEAAEGINTVKVIHALSNSMHLHTPIVSSLYKVMYQGYSIQNALNFLMRLHTDYDVNFDVN